jgi:hypothetical protein
MERWLWTSLGILVAGSVGAFLVVVPMLSAFVIVIIGLGFALMFVLGIRLGGRIATRTFESKGGFTNANDAHRRSADIVPVNSEG